MKTILTFIAILVAGCSTTVNTPAPEPQVIEHRSTVVEPQADILVYP